MIIFYHNDPDGKCAAAIVYQHYLANNMPLPKLVEMDYAKPVPIDIIEKDEPIWIVDFSFKLDIMQQVAQKTLNVTWIDHHITAKDYGYNFKGLRDFTEKGLSGCELTWKYLYPKQSIPKAISLIGDYDAWRLQMPGHFEFYEGLKLEDLSPTSKFWIEIFSKDIICNDIIEQGKTSIKYRDNYCSNLSRGYGYETEIDGHKAYALNAFMFGSKMFGERFKQYPLCVGYIHNGNKFTVSLYSETIDVSVIAKNHGGGGHIGAAGFICDKLPFRRIG